jgi:hypothetical protein
LTVDRVNLTVNLTAMCGRESALMDPEGVEIQPMPSTSRIITSCDASTRKQIAP